MGRGCTLVAHTCLNVKHLDGTIARLYATARMMVECLENVDVSIWNTTKFNFLSKVTPDECCQKPF